MPCLLSFGVEGSFSSPVRETTSTSMAAFCVMWRPTEPTWDWRCCVRDRRGSVRRLPRRLRETYREKAYIEADTAAPDLWAAPVAPIPPTTVSAAPVPVPLADIPGADPRFKTCKEATSGGYGPYTSGADPEYDWYRDPDHDGVVCER